MKTLTRRSLIAGFAGLLAAPALVRASSLMPVKAWKPVAPRLQWVDVHMAQSSSGFFYKGVPIVFDRASGLPFSTRYPAAEPIYRDDIVIIGSDGKAYRGNPALDQNRCVGMALCDSQWT